MILLSTQAVIFEFSAFLVAFLAFVFAVRFFVASRKRLGELFPDMFRAKQLLPFGVDRNGFLLPKQAKGKTVDPVPSFQRLHARPNTLKSESKGMRHSANYSGLNESLGQSRRSSMTESSTSAAFNRQKTWREDELESVRAESFQQSKQASVLSQKLQERLAEMEEEFDNLQEKVRRMEKQAWQATELSAQLEQAEETQAELETALLDKEERLRELVQENQQMHQLLTELEEKLSHSDQKQQQLMKKILFLEEINNDLQQAAEADKKLKLKLNRVAELESMIELLSVRR